MSFNRIKNINTKREFSIEEIAKAINCQNLISSLKYKYTDPLIIRRKDLIKKMKIDRLKKNKSNDPFELKKISFHDFIKNSEKLKVNKILNEDNINNINAMKSMSQDKNQFLITSGMFKPKITFKKFRLRNILSSKSRERENAVKKESIQKINEKYNLKLNLKYLNDNKITKSNYTKRARVSSRKALLNFLIKRYFFDEKNNVSSAKIGDQKNNSKSFSNSIFNNNITDNRINLNDEVNKIFGKFINFNDDYQEQPFITNIKPKDNRYFSEPNRSRKLINTKLLEQNKHIIKHDNSIYIDCLNSNILPNIEYNKLFCGKNIKTNILMKKELWYKNVKKFEFEIDKLVKTPPNEYN